MCSASTGSRRRRSPSCRLALPRLAVGHALEQLARELREPLPGGAGGERARAPPGRRRCETAARSVVRRSLGDEVGLREREHAREARRGGDRGGASSRSIRSKFASSALARGSRRRSPAPDVAAAPESSGARSSTCTSSRVRSTWARNSSPRPAPLLAPSISPGMSAIDQLAIVALRARRARARAS